LAITTEIVRTYRAPREVMRRLLSAGPREDRAIAYLMGACAIIFVGQWPRLQREATLNPDAPPLDAQLAGALFAWLFVAPLLFYGIAALSHLLARAVGGKGAWWSARIALFWSLLAVSPLMLLYGLVAGIVGPGRELSITGGVVLLAFLAIWGISLAEAERPVPEGEA
jgi:hypothetical protein